LYSAAT